MVDYGVQRRYLVLYLILELGQGYEYITESWKKGNLPPPLTRP
ncbi:MAG: hypothetical protein WCF23_17830 [Candidatus Nitrosopolaris sp.]